MVGRELEEKLYRKRVGNIKHVTPKDKFISTTFDLIKEMAPKLYGTIGSPAVRSSLLCLKAIGAEYEYKDVNMMNGEHLTPEYLKINPQHTVPTLEDDGFTIWDSHAINCYLIAKYGKDDSLYPKDLQKRAVIDQRLHFDSGILFPRLVAIVRPILREGVKTIPKEKIDAVIDAYNFLETFLEKSDYLTGSTLSLADLAAVSTVSTLNVLVPIAANRYPNITQWLHRMQQLPYYKEANQTGLDILAGLLKSKMS